MVHIEKDKVYYKVIEYISDEINKGNLKKGEKMPTERELVKNLNVGRNSIREALKILQLTGLIIRNQGRGTYINENFYNFFSEPMVISFMLNRNTGEDIFEFRNMIEKEVAKLTAEKIDDYGVKSLTKIFNKMNIDNDEYKRSKYDSMFHYELAKLTKNLIIINIYNAMKTILDLFIGDIRKKALKGISSQDIYNDHKRIYEAVISKNPKEAVDAMISHISVMKKYYYEYKFNYNYEGNKVSNIVLKYIVTEIREGNLKEGDQVPSERELQKKLKTSRNSVREIYKSLATIGILEYRSNKGTFIKKDISEWVSEPILITFKLSNVSEKDIFEYRKMIETEVAYLAAERITDEEILELKKYYKLMTNTKDESKKAEYDEMFHSIINKAAKNSIIQYTYNAISPVMHLFTYNIRRVVEKNEPEGILEVIHEEIFNSIINRDKERAKNSMKIHMDMIIKYFEF